MVGSKLVNVAGVKNRIWLHVSSGELVEVGLVNGWLLKRFLVDAADRALLGNYSAVAGQYINDLCSVGLDQLA